MAGVGEVFPTGSGIAGGVSPPDVEGEAAIC